MSKAEFLDGLGKSLEGKVDAREYRSQMEYYSSYISKEVASGRSEEEVVGELGDPRLIAKTIVQTYSMKDNPINRQYREKGYNEAYDKEENYNDNEKNGRKTDNMGHILRTIIFVLLVMCIISIVFKAVLLIAPFIMLILIVWFIVRYISSGR